MALLPLPFSLNSLFLLGRKEKEGRKKKNSVYEKLSTSVGPGLPSFHAYLPLYRKKETGGLYACLASLLPDGLLSGDGKDNDQA